MDHIGILVFVSQETLEHKINDGKQCESRSCYWNTARFPKQFLQNPSFEHRLYFAVGGQVKGYFTLFDIDCMQKTCMSGPFFLLFYSESWVPIENGPVLKPSQGWRYFSHEVEST